MGEGQRAYRMTARARAVAETRERIVARARELFLERPFAEVTLQDLAAAADVTRQTVLNHFESKDGVFLAAAESVVTERQATTHSDLDGALDALVEEYEEFGDALVRLLEVEERFPAVHTQLERGRRGHRGWVEATFHDQLASAGSSRPTAVLALVAATDLYVWKLLRRDLGHRSEAAREVIGALVAGVLSELAQDQEEAR